MKPGSTKTSSNPIQRKSAGSPFFSRKGKDSFFSPAVQTKLEVGEANDSYEKEADSMADKVVQKKEASNLAQQVTPIGQRKASKKEEDDKGQVQAKEDGGGNMQDSPKTEEQLNASKGSGSMMSESVQSEMESSFGTDLSNVRVHTDSRAQEMNKDLNAKAFTHGNDIYFGAGNYSPKTQDGKHLLAHELTHTVQQSQGIQRKVIQKAGGGTGTNNTGAKRPDVFESKKEGKVERISGSTYKLTIPTIKLPTIKKKLTPSPLSFRIRKSGERKTGQRKLWDDYMAQGAADMNKMITDKVKKKKAPPVMTNSGNGNPPAVYAFRLSQSSGKKSNLVIGTIDSIRARIARPYWTPKGSTNLYDVDHKLEHQLGGEDKISNLWLLDASANRSSGSMINIERKAKINALISKATGPEADKIWKRRPNPFSAGTYDVEFKKTVRGGTVSGKPRRFYHLDEVRKDLKPLKGLTPLNQKELDKIGFGKKDQILLFPNSTGGRMYRFKLSKDDAADAVNVINWSGSLSMGANGEIQNLTYNKASGEGNVKVKLFKKVPYFKPGVRDIPIRKMNGIPMAGHLPRGGKLLSSLGGFDISLFSPIEFHDAGFEPGVGLAARGKINVKLPFLKGGTAIDLIISGNDVIIQKTFEGGEIKLPKPFSIYSSTLSVSMGLGSGFKASGNVNFGIDRVGEGNVSAYVKDGKFGIKGDFDFDKKLFDNAKAEVAYENDQLSVKGTLGIPEGKVRGIKTATATVSYSGGVLKADGNAELDVKGLEKGTMSLVYSKDALTIGGTFQLSSEIPRLKSGSIEVSVTKKGEEYDMSGKGTAVPDIPGLNTAITVSYQNGILVVEGSLEYEKGIAKGKIMVGFTNRPVDPASGRPGGEPGDSWRVYGSGDLTLRLTPWLQASAGITVKEDGKMEVRGSIGIPSAVNVFERKPLNKNLFKMPRIDIPLFGIPIGSRTLGIAASISGGMDFNAGVGPGKLEELSANINYTPGEEDNITLGGRGKFVIPVDASIRMYGRAGISVSAVIASVTGSLELGASVGIKGAAEAELDVSWSKAKGISLDAVGRVYVEPTLKFDIGLVLEASALFWDKTWRKNLAEKEYGSGMRFGLEFPVKYRQGEAFKMAAKDLKVIRPDISLGQVMKNLGKQMI